LKKERGHLTIGDSAGGDNYPGKYVSREGEREIFHCNYKEYTKNQRGRSKNI
jgi:hypothetical protein